MAQSRPRLPSVASTQFSVRRRSGAFSQSAATRQGTQSYSSSRLLTVKVEDADDWDARPTVLLVQKKRPRSRIPSLPILPPVSGHQYPATEGLLLHIPHDDSQYLNYPVREDTNAKFSPVPLTPVEEHRALPSQSLRSIHASTSDVPLLAMPSEADHRDAFYSLPHLTHSPDSDPGQLSRPPSTASFPMRSLPTPKTLKRPATQSWLSTADRLTQKFPISHTVRGLALDGTLNGTLSRDETRPALASPMSIGSSLEQSRGLGMDRPNRWTAHKWWLFLSVCTVFATGVGGLACALLTWFRGQYLDAYTRIFLMWLMSTV